MLADRLSRLLRRTRQVRKGQDRFNAIEAELNFCIPLIY